MSATTRTILIAIIGALGSIIAALIAAGGIARKTTNATIDASGSEIHELRRQLRDTGRKADQARAAAEKAVQQLATLSGPGTPHFDSGWRAIAPRCKTIEYAVKLDDVPSLLTAYYRLSQTGETFPLATNQYGDSNQTNGVLIDLDIPGDRIYLRLPCGSPEGNNVVHLGWYNSRNDAPGSPIIGRTDVELRVMLWR